MYCHNKIVDWNEYISRFEDYELEIRKKCNGGSALSYAFININGAPNEMKNLHKSIKLEKIINNNDVVTIVETGTTN